MVHYVVPTHLRAGRALLGWRHTALAEASGVSARTIKQLELAPDLIPLPGRLSPSSSSCSRSPTRECSCPADATHWVPPSAYCRPSYRDRPH
jgi:hypothetical protein